jgi:hypothetical protein
MPDLYRGGAIAIAPARVPQTVEVRRQLLVLRFEGMDNMAEINVAEIPERFALEAEREMEDGNVYIGEFGREIIERAIIRALNEHVNEQLNRIEAQAKKASENSGCLSALGFIVLIVILFKACGG